MKQLWNFFLLMGVLCLAGCSEDEPQLVAFSVNELEVGPDATRMTIGIEANCPWTITDEKNKTFTEEREGIGSMETIFIVLTNPDFESKQYTVTITSGDGTSSDVLVVHQKGQYGLETEHPELIAAEGGEVHIPVRTNDRIEKIEMPDWITYTSSRGLTEYTYTFQADTNKTGAVKTGTIRFKGSETNDSVEVKQDSYGPSDIQIKGNIPPCTTERMLSVPFEMIPEYADPTKLTVKALDNCSAEIKDGCLVMTPEDYGTFTAGFFHKATELHFVSSELFPEKLLSMGPTTIAYLGQAKELGYNYYSEDYVLESSSPEIIRTSGNRSIQAVGIGQGTVTVSHPQLETISSVTVNVEPFLLTAETSWTGQLKDGSYDVFVRAALQCAPSTTINGFYLTDPAGKIIFFDAKSITRNGEVIVIAIGQLNVRFDIKEYGSIENAMRQYKVTVSANVDGTTYQKTAVVNGDTV